MLYMGLVLKIEKCESTILYNLLVGVHVGIIFLMEASGLEVSGSAAYSAY